LELADEFWGVKSGWVRVEGVERGVEIATCQMEKQAPTRDHRASIIAP